MQIDEKKTAKSKVSLLVHEIRSLEKLIKQRHEWLDRAENKRRSNFDEVSSETRQSEERLKNLKSDLSLIINNKN